VTVADVSGAHQPVLAVAGLECSFGKTQALRGVDLAVHEGEVIALLGENGAGKSTLIKILAGVYQPTGGTIRLGERTFESGLSPQDARSHGLAFVHQDLGLLGDLSVAENIAHVSGFSTRAGLVSWSRVNAKAAEVLERWQLDVDPRARVDRLEAAERALVAIGRALATNARVIVLDEPTAALPRHDVDILYAAIDRLREGGVGVLYVTHRLGEVRRVADRAAVLRDGNLVGTVDVATTSEARLVEMIVGRALAELEIVRDEPGREIVLRLDGVSGGTAEDVSLELRRGEVLALAGLVGAGQRSVGRMVAGVDALAAGAMSLDGHAYRPRSPRHAQRCGVAYLPGDRLQEAAFLTFDSGTNFSVRARHPLRLIAPRREQEAAGAVFREWDVRPWSPRARFSALSGGNQQKVVLAKWMAERPSVLVADGPTAGIDVGAKAAIYRRLAEAAEAGTSVLLISSDAEEIAEIAQRAIVFRQGRPAVELPKSGLTVDRIAAECYRA
jgi:ribose transport system ATP-binding protein